LFAAAREAAGTSRDVFDAATVDELLDQARARYGSAFSTVLTRSRVWVNGEPVEGSFRLADADEVAVLPPVSGGAVEVPSPSPRRRRLAVVPRDDGPHVRLGLAWALATGLVTAAGAAPLGVWFSIVAALGAAQATRGWRSRPRAPFGPVAIAGAALLPLAAVVGGWAVAAAVTAVAVAAVAVRLASSPEVVPLREPLLTLLVAVPVGLAAASPVLARHLGLVEPLVLLAMVSAYDAGSYLVGSGASAAWEGAAAGAVSLVPVTVAAAVALVPRFAAAPFVLGGIVAVLAPLGPPAATILIGDERASAVRRIDSLLFAGPVWAATAFAMLR